MINTKFIGKCLLTWIFPMNFAMCLGAAVSKRTTNSMECIICSSLKPNIISGIFIFFLSSSVRAKNVWLITHNSIYELRMISSEIHWTTWLVAAAIAAAIMLSPLSSRLFLHTSTMFVCLARTLNATFVLCTSYYVMMTFSQRKEHAFVWIRDVNKQKTIHF